MVKTIADLEREFYLAKLAPVNPEALTLSDLKKMYFESELAESPE